MLHVSVCLPLPGWRFIENFFTAWERLLRTQEDPSGEVGRFMSAGSKKRCFISNFVSSKHFNAHTHTSTKPFMCIRCF